MTSSAAHDPVFVVGFDGSEPARAALVHAARRCASGGRIVAVCAHPEPPGDLSAKAFDALLHQHAEEARSVLDALALAAPPELDDVTWSAESVAGSPADVLCAVAAREGAAEIVVGTHGRGRVSALLGSVAHDLLRLSDRPVAVIPPRAVDALLETPA